MIYTSIYIWYIGYIIEKDISKVTTGMKSILKAKNSIVLNNLPILRNDEIGRLVREFNLLQNNNNSQIRSINNTKTRMIEQERLATLGQMIGGIAHNLKTPIFSISGANMAIVELVKELKNSVLDERVERKDFKEIALDMEKWTKKIDNYLEYMSDVITAVKGQTTVFSDDIREKIVLKDVFKNVRFLLEHEIRKNNIELEIKNYVENDIKMEGNSNILVQVLANLVQNSIDSYEDISKNDENRKIIIESAYDKSKKNIIIYVEDFGSGISRDIADRLFNEMVTTKGKRGTGLRIIYV